MGLALLFVIWLITLLSSYFFVVKTWWFPAAGAAHAAAINAQMVYTFVGMGAIFIVAQLGLGWVVWKYRDRSGGAVEYSHGNTKLEVVWTTLTAALFLGLGVAGADTWAQNRFQGASAGAMQVEVTGVQFAWYFRYPGPDGKFGKIDPTKADASLGSEAALGLDENDPDGRDDIVTQTLFLPIGKEVETILRTQDVIHNFNVPGLWVKQDLVPGLMTRLHFTPTVAGRYELACAELCGLGHYRMRAFVEVQSEEEFSAGQKQRLADKQAE
jgi:cytochrome c oxidase subunit II